MKKAPRKALDPVILLCCRLRPFLPPAGTGSSGNFRRDRSPAQGSQREQLEKQIDDRSLPLVQRIYAREQLQNLREDE